MRSALLLILACCLGFTPALSQELAIEKLERTVEFEMPALVPLRDSIAFGQAIRREQWATADRHVRWLVKKNGRSRKMPFAQSMRWTSGLGRIPAYLSQQPGVLLCILTSGRTNRMQLVVEYAEGVGRQNRVYTLEFTGTIQEETAVPYPGVKGRWKVAGVR